MGCQHGRGVFECPDCSPTGEDMGRLYVERRLSEDAASQCLSEIVFLTWTLDTKTDFDVVSLPLLAQYAARVLTAASMLARMGAGSVTLGVGAIEWRWHRPRVPPECPSCHRNHPAGDDCDPFYG